MLTETIVHEDGDLVYLIAPVSPIEPSAEQIEEFAYGPSIVAQQAKASPNPFIKWYGGHYVEADSPNGNGAMWTAKELALKSLTPRFMPVTVMHDPSTAVGLIADVALLLPPLSPRPKIDTALALWAHRFPEVIEEAQANYELGSLMQSMEAIVPAYSCGECGLGFLKLPKGAERANWCDHLKGETAVRILEATTFTGTGLIFGTRGASGADPLAHLEDFKQEVAEFHQKRQTVKPSPRTSRSKATMEIEQSKYDELMARPTVEALNVEHARANQATKDLETTEAEAVSLRKDVADRDAEIAAFKETARTAVLASDRLGALGDGFLAKLGDKTKARLNEQASTLPDKEWGERLEELEEVAAVKRDAVIDPANTTVESTTATPTFTQEEVARQQVKGALADTSAEQTVNRNVIAGLLKRPAPAKK